jgi:hypothetical protein
MVLRGRIDRLDDPPCDVGELAHLAGGELIENQPANLGDMIRR